MSTGAWSDANAQALGCNSTLEAAFRSALQVPVNAGVGWTEVEYAAAWSCRWSDNSTIARQANKLWPTINSYGVRLEAAVFALRACSSPTDLRCMHMSSVLSLVRLCNLCDGRIWCFGALAHLSARPFAPMELPRSLDWLRHRDHRLVFPLDWLDRRSEWVRLCSAIPRGSKD